MIISTGRRIFIIGPQGRDTRIVKARGVYKTRFGDPGVEETEKGSRGLIGTGEGARGLYGTG